MMWEPMTENQVILKLASRDLFGKINNIVARDAVTFADRRNSGMSASMNGALEYTTFEILREVRKAMGIKVSPDGAIPDAPTT